MPEAASHTKGVMGSGGCGGRAGGSGAGADPEREGAQPGLTEEQKAGIRHVAGHGPTERGGHRADLLPGAPGRTVHSAVLPEGPSSALG